MSRSIPQNHFSNEVDDLHGLPEELFRPVTSDNRPVPNRRFYPLRQHQEEFDEIERRLGRPAIPDFGLNDLKDGGNSLNPPPHTLAVIIKCAILGSPRCRLTLREIRIAMCKRFGHYSIRENNGWCNTIRHTLSTDPNFQSVQRAKTADDSGNWWRLSQNAEPPDVTPQERSRRPTQASSSSSRTRSQGIPTQSRRRRAEVWEGMTTTFAASETQDYEDLGFQYEHMHPSQNSVGQQPGEYAAGYHTSVASTSTAHWQQTAGAATSLAGPSAPGGQLPGIRSLGILELGTRSGSRSHSQLSTNNPQQYSQAAHWGTHDENEDFDEEMIEN